MARRRQLWLWALSFALGYTLFGFFVAPRLLRAIVLWQLPKQIGRPVSLQKIKLNPYTISVALDGFQIAERDGAPFVAWDEIYVNLDPTGLLRRELVVSQIAISNAFGHVQANRDGSFNFSDILQRFPAEKTPKKQTGQPMVARVGELHITGSKAVYDDLTRASSFSTTVGPIDVTLRGFSTDPKNENPYGFTAVTESGEKFSWNGVFNLAPIRSSGEFSIEGIKLGKYAPYYNDFVSLSIHDGKLNLHAHYRAEFTDRLTVAQVSNLTVQVQALKVGPSKSEKTILEVPDLTLADTFFDLVGQVVNVGTFSTRGARYEVERLRDGSLNLVNLLAAPPSTNAPAAAAAPSTHPPPAWVATIRNIAIEDWGFHVTGFLGEQRLAFQALRLANIVAHASPVSLSIDSIALEEPKIEVLIPAGLTNVFAAAASVQQTNAPAEPPASKEPLPPVSIGSILVTNAAFVYQDASLPAPASLDITQLHVAVGRLSTDPKATADLRVTGRVGNLGGFEAAGRINPLQIDAATDLQAALVRMDLVPLGPYAGKYAGYDIRKGKLSVAVKYAIEQRKLSAQNSIEVDQFTFGDKTDSPDAVKLPVKLAVAILKDVNGQIKLDVPIEGHIDDPKFRYGRAVWHVLSGLFTKIFTAPFSMLGSMFGGGGEELGWQEFAPGSSELLPEESQKLDVLIKAMTERPALLLEIEGNVDKKRDYEPIKRQKLDTILVELKAKHLGAVGAPRPTGDPVGRAALNPPLPQDERIAWLRMAYAEALPEIQAKLPPPPEPPKIASNIENFGARSATPAKRAQKVAAELSEQEMERGYFAIIEVTAEDYRQLATQRANRIRDYLLQAGKLETDRVFLADLSKRAPPTAGPRAVFTLQ